VARLLRKQGKKPAILSRGYRGTATGKINIVSDPKKILLAAGTAGDEPRLLAEKLPGTPVVTGSRRSITGSFAVDSFDIDHIILDDGFQHLALQRDLDLVLFNGREPLGNGRVLPGGHLREPLSALKRADAFVIIASNGADSEAMAEFIGSLRKRFPGKPTFTGSYVIDDAMTKILAGKEDAISLSEGRRIPVYGFCGIARPDTFKETLQNSGMDLMGYRVFEDHHGYTLEDIKTLGRDASSSGALALITTEKDLVKVRNLLPPEMVLLALGVRLRMEPEFDRFVQEKLDRLHPPSSGK